MLTNNPSDDRKRELADDYAHESKVDAVREEMREIHKELIEKAEELTEEHEEFYVKKALEEIRGSDI